MAIPQDKGARFYKCDFQVHTPRDARWSGPFRPIEDRTAFAEALVADCRRKGIQAIAITDHHDLCMWKIVRTAAQAERDSSGTPIPTSGQLVIFPGVELTLATPSCQSLLIFDPSLTEGQLVNIWGVLRVTPTSDGDAKTTQTEALHTDLNLGEISEALNSIRTNPSETNPNKYEFLKNRFILLPNVKRGGHKTILRDGFQSHFKEMLCVGGYIEGCLLKDLEQTNKNIVDGKIQQWGARPLGIFQTSDCRIAQRETIGGRAIVNFVDLGAWPTWVKWAEPSAEALRQACLARGSRISQTEPAFPLFQIVGVVISNSSFLGPVELGLNPQFNALIGGRGTGKSSLLEYIRWALCDEPLETIDASELPDFQRRRKRLVDETLKRLNAKVTVYYKRNEVVSRVERSIADKNDTINVYDKDGKGQLYTPDQVRREFPIVSYAQKQLSCVGTLPEEINRLITDPVREKLNQVQDKIEKTLLPELRQQREKKVRLQSLEGQILESFLAIKGKKEQVQALQNQLQSLTPEQKQVMDAHDPLSQQDQTVKRALELPKSISEILDQAQKQIAALGSVTPADNLPSREMVERIANAANAYRKKADEGLTALISETQEVRWLSAAEKQLCIDLDKLFEEHNAQYNKCVQDNAKSTKQLDEIKSLNTQISELETKQSARESERSALKVVVDNAGTKSWDAFLTALEQRATLLREQCEKVAGQAQQEFKPELAFCGNVRPVVEALGKVVQGRNVKDSDGKISTLANLICSSPHPVKKWASVMQELDSIIANKDSGALPETPTFTEAGFTPINLESIRTGMKADVVEQIRYFNIDDQIKFLFGLGKKADGSKNYISFDSASPGQQATCLLRTLLAQEGAPLLIDQPEEDLDNEQIHVLAGRITETKHNRQLIFVSHNANIVVNGDAELVVCFGYRNLTDNTRGEIQSSGSIDCKPVRNTITSIMEGGREAFELRKNKYGF